eukprot:TRINITY_DN2933_c0_g1_i7.p1 TRINITY_DN2933_c0_g1~~TRINITY_DN2933_c0_g1_i7.p1  ORF type:complete len:1021 (+),score=253.80 TRINITY_DN2933_c0_g1_i7:68-3130(+)
MCIRDRSTWGMINLPFAAQAYFPGTTQVGVSQGGSYSDFQTQMGYCLVRNGGAPPLATAPPSTGHTPTAGFLQAFPSPMRSTSSLPGGEWRYPIAFSSANVLQPCHNVLQTTIASRPTQAPSNAGPEVKTCVVNLFDESRKAEKSRHQAPPAQRPVANKTINKPPTIPAVIGRQGQASPTRRQQQEKNQSQQPHQQHHHHHQSQTKPEKKELDVSRREDLDGKESTISCRPSSAGGNPIPSQPSANRTIERVPSNSTNEHGTNRRPSFNLEEPASLGSPTDIRAKTSRDDHTIDHFNVGRKGPQDAMESQSAPRMDMQSLEESSPTGEASVEQKTIEQKKEPMQRKEIVNQLSARGPSPKRLVDSEEHKRITTDSYQLRAESRSTRVHPFEVPPSPQESPGLSHFRGNSKASRTRKPKKTIASSDSSYLSEASSSEYEGSSRRLTKKKGQSRTKMSSIGFKEDCLVSDKSFKKRYASHDKVKMVSPLPVSPDILNGSIKEKKQKRRSKLKGISESEEELPQRDSKGYQRNIGELSVGGQNTSVMMINNNANPMPMAASFYNGLVYPPQVYGFPNGFWPSMVPVAGGGFYVLASPMTSAPQMPAQIAPQMAPQTTGFMFGGQQIPSQTLDLQAKPTSSSIYFQQAHTTVSPTPLTQSNVARARSKERKSSPQAEDVFPGTGEHSHILNSSTSFDLRNSSLTKALPSRSENSVEKMPKPVVLEIKPDKTAPKIASEIKSSSSTTKVKTIMTQRVDSPQKLEDFVSTKNRSLSALQTKSPSGAQAPLISERNTVEKIDNLPEERKAWKMEFTLDNEHDDEPVIPEKNEGETLADVFRKRKEGLFKKLQAEAQKDTTDKKKEKTKEDLARIRKELIQRGKVKQRQTEEDLDHLSEPRQQEHSVDRRIGRGEAEKRAEERPPQRRGQTVSTRLEMSRMTSPMNPRDAKEQKNQELLNRLAMGVKTKVSKKEMIEMTNKHYAKLPEVVKKREEKRRKDEKAEDLKRRKEKVKQLDERLRKTIVTQK